ncbi:MAG: hypothetical protein QME66_05525 [Candidatus Eisenbacteria bacterium]|nr:hypothetical protein [Candidatus Eisenbacteria bacterium]
MARRRFSGPEETIGGFAVNIARAPFRAAATIGTAIGRKPAFTPGEGIPSLLGRIERALLGPETIGFAESQRRFEETTKELGLAPKTARALSFPAVIAGLGFDVSGFGGTEKRITEQLVKAKTVDAVLGVLRRTKIPSTLSRRFAQEFAQAETPEAVRETTERMLTTALPEEKLTIAIREAGPVRREQELLYTQERARRAARVAEMGKQVPGERGFFAQLGQLRGELPKKQFAAVRDKFTQADVDAMYQKIENAPLLPFEKISTKTGLQKLFDGVVPAEGELNSLGEIFSKDLMDAVKTNVPLSTRIIATIGEVLNIPRSLMASLDFSAPLKQGVFLIGRPKQFLPAFTEMFKFAFSEKAYQGLQQSIRARSTYRVMEDAGLALTDLGKTLTKREEAIMSSLPERIPVIGRIVRGSNRSFSGFLNKLRADTFDAIIGDATKGGRQLTERELRDVGKFVNAATGRGSAGALERAAPVLNAIFFSPKLLFSRLNLMNPFFYTSLTPPARKEALKSLFSFSAIAGTVLGLMKLGGAEVGTDPRSADFGKAKFGDTRYDILGGFQQPLRTVGQLISGEVVSSTTGRTITLGEGYKPLTRFDIAQRFFENKESPIASLITSWLRGKTFTGEDFDFPTEVISRFIPIVMQDIYDLSQDPDAKSIMGGLPAIFGVGVQTYGTQELVEGKSKIGEPTLQVRPVQELSRRIRELVLGQLPLGTSKRFSVEAYLDQLDQLPKQEAADIFDKIIAGNPELAKEIERIKREEDEGITVHDRDLKTKGVASGDRAMAIKKELDAFKTDEERAKLWDDYTKKRIITEEVARQLSILIKGNRHVLTTR